MPTTYDAFLIGDHIEWAGERPESIGAGLRVPVKIVLEATDRTGVGERVADRAVFSFKTVRSVAEAEPWTEEMGRQARAALERIAARGNLRDIDPVAWQREVRQDRPLLGREP